MCNIPGCEPTKCNDSFNQGVALGKQEAQEKIVAILESFFELTQWSVDNEDASENPEWDRGFQAAMALARKPLNE